MIEVYYDPFSPVANSEVVGRYANIICKMLIDENINMADAFMVLCSLLIHGIRAYPKEMHSAIIDEISKILTLNLAQDQLEKIFKNDMDQSTKI